MKAILLLLIALFLVLTAHMRENNAPDAINPADELIDRELLQEHITEQTEMGSSHYEAAPFLYKKRHSGCTNLNAGGKM